MIELYLYLSVLFAVWYLADNVIHADDVESYRVLALETFIVLIAWPAILLVILMAGIEKVLMR